ncbi:MAG: hypothetical protein K2J83_02695 [Clostridia bacterium]|nr:hypothetical protein [Clostridia bacterium]
MKDFTVEFALCDSEYMTALRLTAGAVCSASDVDVDAIEDFKVCVTESALIFKNCGFESVKARFFRDNGVGCEISGIGGKPRSADNELSLALISALVSSCNITGGKVIEKVTLLI